MLFISIKRMNFFNPTLKSQSPWQIKTHSFIKSEFHELIKDVFELLIASYDFFLVY